MLITQIHWLQITHQPKIYMEVLLISEVYIQTLYLLLTHLSSPVFIPGPQGRKHMADNDIKLPTSLFQLPFMGKGTAKLTKEWSWGLSASIVRFCALYFPCHSQSVKQFLEKFLNLWHLSEGLQAETPTMKTGFQFPQHWHIRDKQRSSVKRELLGSERSYRWWEMLQPFAFLTPNDELPVFAVWTHYVMAWVKEKWGQ